MLIRSITNSKKLNEFRSQFSFCLEIVQGFRTMLELFLKKLLCRVCILLSLAFSSLLAWSPFGVNYHRCWGQYAAFLLILWRHPEKSILSISLIKAKIVSSFPQPKHLKICLAGETIKEGVFSLWKGQHPAKLLPALLSGRYFITISTIYLAWRMSASIMGFATIIP